MKISDIQQKQLRFLMIGAHPDDCELKTGGIAIRYSRLGHKVKFVSATNGDTGHYEIGGAALAIRRVNEARAGCATAGIESEVLDIHNNGIEADIRTRELFIKLIREFRPDIIFTHRLNDYHPDHRRTAMLVQDSSYAIRIPNVCPLTPCMDYTPVIMYMSDSFKKPNPFEADVVFDIDDVMDTKVKMLDCYESQVYEWLPWMDGELDTVPKDPIGRLEWLKQKMLDRDGKTAKQFRKELVEKYGAVRGNNIKCAEVFEVSEYGAPLTEEKMKLYGFTEY